MTQKKAIEKAVIRASDGLTNQTEVVVHLVPENLCQPAVERSVSKSFASLKNRFYNTVLLCIRR